MPRRASERARALFPCYSSCFCRACVSRLRQPDITTLRVRYTNLPPPHDRRAAAPERIGGIYYTVERGTFGYGYYVIFTVGETYVRRTSLSSGEQRRRRDHAFPRKSRNFLICYLCLSGARVLFCHFGAQPKSGRSILSAKVAAALVTRSRPRYHFNHDSLGEKKFAQHQPFLRGRREGG